jgi:lysophospholipase L1-like esterase
VICVAALVLAICLPVASASASARATLVLHQGQALSFYVSAPEVDATFAGNGSTLTAFVNDKGSGLRVTLGLSGTQRKRLAWDLPAGPQRFTLLAINGELDILSWSYGGGTRMNASSLPLTVVYGDSIADGRLTGGGDGLTGGWADQIAHPLRTRVANVGAAGASAACWGATHTGRVIGRQPSRAVIVAFGTNDMVPGVDEQGCNPTRMHFARGIERILSALDAISVPVYVSAILPVLIVNDSVRARWNGTLHRRAVAHGDIYVDPSHVLNTSTDYAGALHPNQAGHDKLARFWTALLS